LSTVTLHLSDPHTHWPPPSIFHSDTRADCPSLFLLLSVLLYSFMSFNPSIIFLVLPFLGFFVCFFVHKPQHTVHECSHLTFGTDSPNQFTFTPSHKVQNIYFTVLYALDLQFVYISSHKNIECKNNQSFMKQSNSAIDR